MKVKEIIDKCEELLEVKSTKEELLDCFNLVENELALSYLPLYATHYCDSNVVYYADFEYHPIRIVSCDGKFKLYPEYIESKEAITEIKYAYTPNQKDLYDECSYNDACVKCLVYGTVAEYLLSQCFYEEAALWHKKYKNEIEMLRF
jgi:hypothetical protein